MGVGRRRRAVTEEVKDVGEDRSQEVTKALLRVLCFF